MVDVRFDDAYRDDVCCIHTFRSLLVLRWLREPDKSTVDAAAAAVISSVRRMPRQALMCTLVTKNVKLPDGPTREVLQRGIREIDPKLTGAVNVILSTGFQAAAMRGMLSGLSLVSKHKHPVAFVGTIEEAVTIIDRQWPAEDAPPPGRIQLATALMRLASR